MAKMFYSLEETAQQLGISIDQVKSLGANGDLQVFRDRDKMMFKRDQVDSLAEERGDTQAVSGDSDSVILLEDTGGSGDDGGSEGLAGLGESSVLGGSGIAMGDDVKEESGVLADSGEGSGVNILEDEGLALDDSGAQTQMAGPGESGDELVLESNGSGSGLLDLASDNEDGTSIGKDLLDEISLGDSGAETKIGPMPSSSGVLVNALDVEGSGLPTGMFDGESSVAEPVNPASSGLVIGLLIAAMTWLIITMFVTFYAIADVSMSLTNTIGDNLLIYTAIGLGISGVLGVVGFVTGKIRDR